MIEAAHFDPVSIFRTQRRHKLPSEASKRFERGVDPTLPEAAADRVAELLVDARRRHRHRRGHQGRPRSRAAPGHRRTDLPARVTGMEIDEATTVAHLRGGRLRGRRRGRNGSPRSSRRGARTSQDPFDLVEEVARIVGYDHIPSVLPTAPAGRGLTTGQQLRRRVGRTLAGAGFVEVVSFPFVGAGRRSTRWGSPRTTTAVRRCGSPTR